MGTWLKNMLTHRQRVRTRGKGAHTLSEMENHRARTLSSASGARVGTSSRSRLSASLSAADLPGLWVLRGQRGAQASPLGSEPGPRRVRLALTLCRPAEAWLGSCRDRVPLAPSRRESMPSSGHRLRDVEHHPLLTGDDSYDSAASSPAEADAADRVWFIRDGCGMICAVLTWLLVVYADFVVTFVMLLPSKDFWYSVVNGVVFNCLAVLALSSHLRTMLTDPVSACPRWAFLSGPGWGDTSGCGWRASHSRGLGV